MQVHTLDQAVESYRFVDDIPDVYDARQVVRGAATALLEERRSQVLGGAPEYIPVDALSSADAVVVAETSTGLDSDAYQTRWRGLLLDCERLVGEWYRKNTSEYFQPTRHVFRTDQGEFFSHGFSIQQMTHNAVVPIAGDSEEEDRRVNEYVEEQTPQILRSIGGVALGRGIVTVSQCTDSAITSYESDMAQGVKHRGYRGYVPEIRKVMLRHITLDPASNDRFQTQIGLPGLYLTDEIWQMALAERGLNMTGMDKTKLHGAQFLAEEDPMELVRHVDAVASREWCVPVFMGERVPDDHIKDYEQFKQQAIDRANAMRGWSETVALFVLDLARSGFDRQLAPQHVEDFVKHMLLNVAKQDLSVAEQMFDATTAQGLAEVVSLEQQGDRLAAAERFMAVQEAAPGGGSCGGGSCGLESVLQNSKEDSDLRKEVGADDKDTLVKDTVRACRCGQKSIVYAYTKSKVIKFCQSCKHSEKSYNKVA